MNPLQSNQIPQVLWESRKLFECIHNDVTYKANSNPIGIISTQEALTLEKFSFISGVQWKSVLAYNKPKKKLIYLIRQAVLRTNCYLSVILLPALLIHCNNGSNDFTSSDQLEKQLWTTWIYYKFKQFVVFYFCNMWFPIAWSQNPISSPRLSDTHSIASHAGTLSPCVRKREIQLYTRCLGPAAECALVIIIN